MNTPRMPWKYPAGGMAALVILAGPQMRSEAFAENFSNPWYLFGFFGSIALMGYAIGWLFWRRKRSKLPPQ